MGGEICDNWHIGLFELRPRSLGRMSMDPVATDTHYTFHDVQYAHRIVDDVQDTH